MMMPTIKGLSKTKPFYEKVRKRFLQSYALKTCNERETILKAAVENSICFPAD